MPRVVAACLALSALLAVAFVIRSATGHPPGVLYLAAEGLPALPCLWSAARRPRERLGWALIGAALVLQTAGDAYWDAAYGGMVDPPSPNPADLLFLAGFACGLSGVLALMRDRLAPLRAPLVLDGAMAGLSLGAWLTVLLLGPVLAGNSGSATGLAYIAADLLMLGVLGLVFGLSGWRPGRGWTLLVGWALLHVVGDAWFSYAHATGAYVPGWWLVAYPLSQMVAAVAAFRAPRARARARDTTMLIAMPAVLALGDLGILLWAALGDVPDLAAVLATAALLVAAARSGVTLAAHQRLLRASRRDALTDALTGLANRRRLVADLAHAAALAGEGVPSLLLFFDLDGFKAYNDRFGHAAGDALLARLGDQLAAAVAGRGVAYRPGGDEFCVILHDDPAAAAPVAAGARRALADARDGVVITTSCGEVALPAETADAEAALKLADARMYAAKRERHALVAA